MTCPRRTSRARHCPLARFGHSRDHRPDRAQIEFGLLTDARGCPVAVEAFPGNTADPATVEAQVDKLRARFGLAELVLVGDRGMLTRPASSPCARPAASAG